MRRKIGTTLLSVFTSIVLFACLSLYFFRLVLQGGELQPYPGSLRNPSNSLHHLSFAIREEEEDHHQLWRSRRSASLIDSLVDSILFPDWEVLLVSPPEDSPPRDSGDRYYCLFQNNDSSPAKYVGELPFGNRVTFKCVVPKSVRNLRPLLGPALTKSPGIRQESVSEPGEMLRWNFLAYESLSTEDDVILFVKGVNNRQGLSRSIEKLRCVFTTGVNHAVKTAVTSSTQEVFRCPHPKGSAIRRLLSNGDDTKIRISLELLQSGGEVVVPSVAYYAPVRSIADEGGKSLLCACTMVRNVAKFLKEWVMYHSKIGVEKFILYDNESNDELQKVVEELVKEDYNVKVLSWPWPKTQEAGFSHSAIYARDSCTWLMYLDVDEFVFSPSWLNSSYPSHDMLASLLPNANATSSSSSSSSSLTIGQVLIKCLEFGPSNQKSHPKEGVMQGYTCRRRAEQRHKSIVLLEAIDGSLRNVIHHFQLKEGYYRGRTLTLREALVNHYKYQAWSEFKEKFRRRVSTYVVDWTRGVNLNSKDRTPGLGSEAIEPEGWANQFCERNDSRLKVVSQRWFGSNSSTGYRMAWQDADDDDK